MSMTNHMIIVTPVIQRETGVIVAYQASTIDGVGICFGKTHAEAIMNAIALGHGVETVSRKLEVVCECPSGVLTSIGDWE